MNDAAIDEEDETHPTTVNWVFFQGKRKPSPNRPFCLNPDFLPRFGGYGKSMEHWMTLIEHRRKPTRWCFWPECTIGQVKKILSCFLVDIAPGNMKIEIERTTAESNEGEESSETFVELDDDNLVLAELPESQCEYRSMNVKVRKKKDKDLWDSYWVPGKCHFNFPKVPKIPKKYMDDARVIMEEHWLEFVLEHEGLLYRFFDYNDECFENWEFKHEMMHAAYRARGRCHPARLIVDEWRNRRSRFETIRSEIIQQKNKKKDKPISDEIYSLINNLCFDGNPRGC
jgi:hypothetical protein